MVVLSRKYSDTIFFRVKVVKSKTQNFKVQIVTDWVVQFPSFSPVPKIVHVKNVFNTWKLSGNVPVKPKFLPVKISKNLPVKQNFLPVKKTEKSPKVGVKKKFWAWKSSKKGKKVGVKTKFCTWKISKNTPKTAFTPTFEFHAPKKKHCFCWIVDGGLSVLSIFFVFLHKKHYIYLYNFSKLFTWGFNTKWFYPIPNISDLFLHKTMVVP